MSGLAPSSRAAIRTERRHPRATSATTLCQNVPDCARTCHVKRQMCKKCARMCQVGVGTKRNCNSDVPECARMCQNCGRYVPECAKLCQTCARLFQYVSQLCRTRVGHAPTTWGKCAGCVRDVEHESRRPPHRDHRSQGRSAAATEGRPAAAEPAVGRQPPMADRLRS